MSDILFVIAVPFIAFGGLLGFFYLGCALYRVAQLLRCLFSKKKKGR